MQTYQIDVSTGRDRVHEIRMELFNFPEVLDVFVTSRPESLVVVFWGRPRPGEWLGALRALGYEVPARRHPTASGSQADRTDLSVAFDSAPGGRLVTGPTRRTGEGRRKIMKKSSAATPTGAHRH